jgi:hypothetical protein
MIVTNPLWDKFFPDVYYTLITDYTGTKKYIDATDGSNSNSGNEINAAYATIDYAISQNTTATPTMYIILEGTYSITSVATGQSVGLRDGGNERVFVCCPGKAIIQWTATASGRDAPMIAFTNTSSKIYGAIVKRNNNGRTTNYTVAYWIGPTKGNMHNCVFSEVNANNAWSYQYDNYGQNNLALRNCTFYNSAAPAGNYTNAGICLTIDSVFNTTVTTGGTETNVLKSQTVNATTYETTGVTTAGVYSGTYSWSATITEPSIPLFYGGAGGTGGPYGGGGGGASGWAGLAGIGASGETLAAGANAAALSGAGGGGGTSATNAVGGGGGVGVDGRGVTGTGGAVGQPGTGGSGGTTGTNGNGGIYGGGGSGAAVSTVDTGRGNGGQGAVVIKWGSDPILYPLGAPDIIDEPTGSKLTTGIVSSNIVQPLLLLSQPQPVDKSSLFGTTVLASQQLIIVYDTNKELMLRNTNPDQVADYTTPGNFQVIEEVSEENDPRLLTVRVPNFIVGVTGEETVTPTGGAPQIWF